MLRWLTHPCVGVAAVVALLTGAAFFPTEPPASAAPVPVRVLAVGDSRTSGGQWQAELGVLLDAGGVPHVIETEAVPGTSCSYWPSRIRAALIAHRPDLVIFLCGTNDNPDTLAYGEPATGWAWRAVVEAVHATGARTTPAFVQYSDPILAPDWLLTREPGVNDIIYRQFVRYPASWLAGMADLQQIPSTADYLAADPYPAPPGWIGIHPNAKGYRTMAQVLYRAAAASMGWPSIPAPCGMHGHRKGYARPTYDPCPTL